MSLTLSQVCLALGSLDSPTVWKECSCSSSALDLAALEEGHLSEQGMRRLAAHMSKCKTCMAMLALCVKDSQSADSSGVYQTATWFSPDYRPLPGQPVAQPVTAEGKRIVR
jgi:hypothetical protein